MIYFIIIAIGACLGSFITAASYRLPRGEDIVFAPSKCPKCNARLKPRDLFPVLSWLANRARCRMCKAPVSARYVATEIIMAAITLLLFVKFGLSPQFAIFTLLATILMVTIVADFETYIMPDSMTIAALCLGMGYIYYQPGNWQGKLLGFGVCLLVALAMRYGYRLLTKKEGLGMGDVKFLPVAGLWLGWELLPVYFIFAGLLGVVTAILWRILFKNPIFPFGPALAAGMFVICVFEDTVLNIIRF